MTIPSEQWLVTALREATERTPLPPESRWIREPGAKTSAWAIAVVVAAAIILVLVAGAIGALRLEPRVVPSTQYDAFRTTEEAAWMRLRSDVPPDLILLRPTWMPAEFVGSADCPSPVASALQSYPYERLVGSMRYNGPLRPDRSCSSIQIVAIPELLSLPPVGLVGAGTVDARGRVVYVSVNAPSPPGAFRTSTYLMWHEFGATYSVSSADTTLADLIRIVDRLQPVR